MSHSVDTVKHALVREGWPHDRTGTVPMLRENVSGYAVCTCGLVSPIAGPQSWRERWLRMHTREQR